MNRRAHGVDGARGNRPQRVADVGGLRRRATRVEHDARRVAPAAPVQGPEPVLLRREEHGDAAREQRGDDRRAARRQARRLDAEGRVALVARGVAAAAVGAVMRRGAGPLQRQPQILGVRRAVGRRGVGPEVASRSVTGRRDVARRVGRRHEARHEGLRVGALARREALRLLALEGAGELLVAADAHARDVRELGNHQRRGPPARAARRVGHAREDEDVAPRRLRVQVGQRAAPVARAELGELVAAAHPVAPVLRPRQDRYQEELRVSGGFGGAAFL